MYQKILITLENGPADVAIVPHILELAGRFGSEVLLLHVADGFAARCFDQLKLAGVDLNFVLAVVPLNQTSTDVDQAASLAELHLQEHRVVKEAVSLAVEVGG